MGGATDDTFDEPGTVNTDNGDILIIAVLKEFTKFYVRKIELQRINGA